MKTLAIFLSLFILVSVPSLPEIRKKYIMANTDAKVANTLYSNLSSITKENKAIFIAYKGAVSIIKAKHVKGVKQKKTFFKEGVALLELAIEKAPENIEIRCLRLGVQENSPKFLKYKSAIKTDKQFIIDHYKAIKSSATRKFVKDYITQSSLFNSEEKQLF